MLLNRTGCSGLVMLNGGPKPSTVIYGHTASTVHFGCKQAVLWPALRLLNMPRCQCQRFCYMVVLHDGICLADLYIPEQKGLCCIHSLT